MTSAQHARFMSATSRTESERYGSSAVFHLQVHAAAADALGPVPGTPCG